MGPLLHTELECQQFDRVAFKGQRIAEVGELPGDSARHDGAVERSCIEHGFIPFIESAMSFRQSIGRVFSSD